MGVIFFMVTSSPQRRYCRASSLAWSGGAATSRAHRFLHERAEPPRTGSSKRWLGRRPARARLHIPKFDEKDPAPLPMLGDLEKVNEPDEARTASECWSDVCELNFK
jgi:hypothetical protein